MISNSAETLTELLVAGLSQKGIMMVVRDGGANYHWGGWKHGMLSHMLSLYNNVHIYML